jgi:hypothetical protein
MIASTESVNQVPMMRLNETKEKMDGVVSISWRSGMGWDRVNLGRSRSLIATHGRRHGNRAANIRSPAVLIAIQTPRNCSTLR